MLLGDLTVETSTDPEPDDSWICDPPSPCDVHFKNANVVINGKSSLRDKSRHAEQKVWFFHHISFFFCYCLRLCAASSFGPVYFPCTFFPAPVRLCVPFCSPHSRHSHFRWLQNIYGRTANARCFGRNCMITLALGIRVMYYVCVYVKYMAPTLARQSNHKNPLYALFTFDSIVNTSVL